METNSINSFLVLITGDIDNFMYTYILVALLVFTGIYFTIRTKGVQFRYIKDMFTQLFEKKVDKNGKAISSFQAMMVSTGSRVGTGNIAGIATALAMGGPGALFWMWVMALIGGASAFIESTLAQIFKIRGKDGQFRGGPAYYIQQGLGKRWMGIVFAVSLIACYVVGFNELQAYNAASGLEYYIPDYATNGAAVVLGVVFTIATAAVIFGGQKRISVINSWVVPIMALAYIGLGVWITFSHLNLLPAAFGMMFASAFDFQAIFGGFAGSALMLGIKRGLFSNEAGMGSAPNRCSNSIGLASREARPGADAFGLYRYALHLHVFGHDRVGVHGSGSPDGSWIEWHAARPDGGLSLCGRCGDRLHHRGGVLVRLHQLDRQLLLCGVQFEVHLRRS